MRIFTLVVAAMIASSALAAPPPEYKGLVVDLAPGVTIPVAESKYLDYADPTFKLALVGGWEFKVANKFALGPELQMDFIPVNVDDNTFRNASTSFFRFRFLAGGRFVLRLGIADLFFRAQIGVDHITGNIVVPLFGRSDWTSTAFVFMPAVGVQFHVVKHLVLGFLMSFPVAPHDFGTRAGSPGQFTAFDIELLGFAGFRY
jgi:hypothetical protein